MNLLCAECLVGYDCAVTETPAATLVDGDALCADHALRRVPLSQTPRPEQAEPNAAARPG